MSTTDIFGGSNLTLVISGTATTQTITQNNGGTMSGIFQVNKSSGTASLSTSFTTGSTCNVVEGTLDTNGSNFTCGSTFTVENGGTLELFGSETISQPTFNSGSSAKYTGDGDSSADTYYINNWSYQNLTVAMTDSADTLSTGDTLSNGLQEYWKMDDSSGSTITDDSGNSKNGSANGSSIVSGHINNARRLNGTSDYLSFNNPALPTGDFTYTMWVNTTDNDSQLFMASNGSGGNELWVKINGGTLQGLVNDSTAANATTTVHDGAWHLVTFTRSGSTYSIWVDEGAAEGNNTDGSTLNYSSCPLYIGVDIDTGCSGSLGQYMAGDVDEVRVYNRALSQTEIEAIYNEGSTAITTLTVAGAFTLSSGTFTAPSGNFNVAGNFVHSGGTFTNNSGTVVLNGTGQTVSGDTTFNNLTKSVSSADTLTFGASDTQTITGTITLTGASGNLLTLVTSSNGTQWKFDPQGTRSISYVSVSYSNNINGTEITAAGNNITDGGHNTNWLFNQNPNTPSSLGPSSLVSNFTTNDSTPTLTFTLSDPDSGDTVKFTIQIDDSSDFSSNVVNYTSALSSQGSFSFTVGQAAGSGTYTTGNVDQELSDGSYYWRVKATDNTGTASSYATANSGSAAFVVDGSAPLAFTLSEPSNNSYINTERPAYKWKTASDNSSLSKYKFEVDNGDSGDFTIDNIPVSRTLPYSGNGYTINYEGFGDGDSSNNYISILTDSSNAWGDDNNDGKLNPGQRTWTVYAYDNAGNRTDESRTIFYDSSAPSLSSVKVNNTSSNAKSLITKDTKPTISGRITDNLSNDVASGPDKASFDFRKKELFGTYTSVLSGDISIDKTYWSNDNSEISDNSKNDSDKYGDFSFTPETPLDKGDYEIVVTGYDKAGNSTSQTIDLTIGELPLTSNEKAKENVSKKTPVKNNIAKNENNTEDNNKNDNKNDEKVVEADNNQPNILINVVGAVTETVANIVKDTYFTITSAIRNLSNLPFSGEINVVRIVVPESLVGKVGHTLDTWLNNDKTEIHNVHVAEKGNDYVIISWETNHYATSKVNYGDSYDYGKDVQDNTLVKEHSIKISGLKPKTTYYYEVMSQGKNYVFDARHEFKTGE